MDRPGCESAEDNLLKSVESNNIHGTDNAESGLDTAPGHPNRQTSVGPDLEGAEYEDSGDSNSDSEDDEHHEFPPDS